MYYSFDAYVGILDENNDVTELEDPMDGLGKDNAVVRIRIGDFEYDVPVYVVCSPDNYRPI